MTHLEQFLFWEKSTPNTLFLRQPIRGEWKTWTYQEGALEIKRMATALCNLGLNKGDNIAILSKNCAHWIMADLAIGMAGFVSVPIYPTLSSTGIRYVLEHSESKLIFIGKLDGFDQQRPGIPAHIQKITFPFYAPKEGMSWNDLILCEPVSVNLPKQDEIAAIMYSSGTTAAPKGVMLSYKAFDFVGRSLVKNFKIKRSQRFVSYLPLSHIAEKAYVQMGVIYTGSSISFTESIETFANNVREIKPNLFGGVPRIFAKLQEGILSKLPQPKLDKLLALPVLSYFVKKSLAKETWI